MGTSLCHRRGACASIGKCLAEQRVDEALHLEGGEVVCAAALVDRSGGTADLGVPFFPLIQLNFPTYAPDELPPELQDSEAVKPGSRKN